MNMDKKFEEIVSYNNSHLRSPKAEPRYVVEFYSLHNGWVPLTRSVELNEAKLIKSIRADRFIRIVAA
jgi:hypothetical protein